MSASLVMRDKETDSWWSIMTSRAIGGELVGAELRELPIGEKATWGDWRSRHPETLVLSVDGVEHVPENPYDEYFASEATFRDLQIEDTRLPPKTPIFSFWWGETAYAVPHSAFEGGALFRVAERAERLFLDREVGAPLFASTEAAWVPADTARRGPAAARAAVEAGQGTPIEGFDTFWYNWIAVNSGSALLGP